MPRSAPPADAVTKRSTDDKPLRAIAPSCAFNAYVPGLLVPGLGHQHQQAHAVLAQVGQRRVSQLVQVPAGARPADGVWASSSARTRCWDSTLPGPERRWVRNTGPPVRSLSRRGSSPAGVPGVDRRTAPQQLQRLADLLISHRRQRPRRSFAADNRVASRTVRRASPQVSIHDAADNRPLSTPRLQDSSGPALPVFWPGTTGLSAGTSRRDVPQSP